MKQTKIEITKLLREEYENTLRLSLIYSRNSYEVKMSTATEVTITHIKKVHTDKEILDSLEEIFPLSLSIEDSPKYTVFISAPYMMPNIEAFKTFFENRKINVLLPDECDRTKERLEEADLLRYIGKYDIALIGDDRYTAHIIRLGFNGKGKKLIGLMKWGTGIDSIDQDAARECNVVIKNTPDAFSEPVAESILGAILSFNRGLLSSTSMMQQNKGSWVKIPGKTINETTFGIIGLGNVGRATAKKLLVLGASQILTYDVIGKIDLGFDRSGIIRQEGSMNAVLDSNPDFLLITCCQTKDNIKMIGTSEIRRLNKGKTVLINMARGSLIDETALIDALQNTDDPNKPRLAGAALDVFWDEPLPADSVLRSLPNVILTSHNANSSPLYWLKVHLNTVRNTLSTLSCNFENGTRRISRNIGSNGEGHV